MTTETQAKPDDFDAAFSQFAKDEAPAEAAAAGGESAAAPGGDNGVSNDGGASAVATGGDAPADTGDGGAGADGGAEGAKEGASSGEAEAAADASGSEAGAEGQETPAAKPTEAPAASAAPEGPSADDILAGLKKLVGDAKPAAEAPAAAPAAAPEAKPLYTQDEQEFLAQYDKDWGDVVKGESLRRRAEYKDLLDYVFQQVIDYVRPIQETAEALAERTFRSELATNVPDYSDNLREQVISWAKTQPAYLQAGYDYVINQGTVEEVKDLIDRFRASTGQTAPAAAPKPAGAGNELSEQAKKAAKALAPVDSKRSVVPATSDPANFDDAWKQAAAELG